MKKTGSLLETDLFPTSVLEEEVNLETLNFSVVAVKLSHYILLSYVTLKIHTNDSEHDCTMTNILQSVLLSLPLISASL